MARVGEETLRLRGDEPPALMVALRSDGRDLGALERLFEDLRARSSRVHLRQALGVDHGFRIEDAASVVLAVPPEADGAALERWLGRRLDRASAFERITRPGPLALAALLRLRSGAAPGREAYQCGADGRVRVEAFELHVVEHCNLRCAHCCNMSPLNPQRFLSVGELRATCERMATAVRADVLKVSGGEPLLHPDIAAILRMMRASGVSERVRLFTNGLLLASMGDDFWDALDELTISSYASAPVKPAILALVRERVRRHDVVLNIKPVSEFSEVLTPHYRRDDAVNQRIFDTCWLRHRCLVARDGHFYACTRAAYGGDFLRLAAHEPVPAGADFDRTDDGVALAGPDLGERIARYLNRSQPLAACRYCNGGEGAVEPHYQLGRDELVRGLLARARPPGEETSS